jgi:hypothetical protein
MKLYTWLRDNCSGKPVYHVTVYPNPMVTDRPSYPTVKWVAYLSGSNWNMLGYEKTVTNAELAARRAVERHKVSREDAKAKENFAIKFTVPY